MVVPPCPFDMDRTGVAGAGARGEVMLRSYRVPTAAMCFVIGAVITLGAGPVRAGSADPTGESVTVLGVDGVGRLPGLPPCADLLAVTRHRGVGTDRLRISFLSLAERPAGLFPGSALATGSGSVPLRVTYEVGADAAKTLFDGRLEISGGVYAAAGAGRRAADPDAIWLDLPADLPEGPLAITVSTLAGESGRRPGSARQGVRRPLRPGAARQPGARLHRRLPRPQPTISRAAASTKRCRCTRATAFPATSTSAGRCRPPPSGPPATVIPPTSTPGWPTASARAGPGMITSAYASTSCPSSPTTMNDWAVEIETADDRQPATATSPPWPGSPSASG